MSGADTMDTYERSACFLVPIGNCVSIPIAFPEGLVAWTAPSLTSNRHCQPESHTRSQERDNFRAAV